MIAICLYSISSFGQVPTNNADERPIKVKTVLVNLPVVVSDKDGRNIVGLAKEDFLVRQEGASQAIQFFISEDGPVHVAIVIDCSGSTRAVLRDITRAARDFLQVLGAEDKGIVVSFDSGVHMMLNDFTADKGRLKDAINNVQTLSDAGSIMNDAVFRLITREFAPIQGKKAIIVLTDGDVSGKIDQGSLLRTLAESDVVVYPIFFQTRRLLPAKVKTISFADLVKIPPVNNLYSISLTTGGRLYVADGSDFSTAFQNIAAELKKQYVIGFYPANTETGDVNDIRIEVNRPGAVVRTKQTIRVKTPDPEQKPPSK